MEKINFNRFSDGKIGSLGIVFGHDENFLVHTERDIAMHMHMHIAYEMHILLEGKAFITTEQGKYILKSGEIALIPPKIYHSITNSSKTFLILSFSFLLYQTSKADTPEGEQLLETLEALNKSSVVLLKDQPQITCCIQKLAHALTTQELANSYLCNAYATVILVYLFRALPMYLKKADDAQDRQSSRSTQMTQIERMNTIESYFYTNYMDASISELAHRMYLSEQHTRRFLRENYDMSFSQFLNKHRANVCKWLLRNTNKSVSEIWKMVGFNSAQNFSVAFKKATGVCASEYRAKNRAAKI